ncbi:sortase [candidate division WWE3 bacterium]|nr:sortase [candidate division WWE3 bacterium]
MEPIVLEYRYHFPRLIGAALITVGGVGLVYLGWIYFIWSNTLPKFDNTALFTVDTPSVISAVQMNSEDGTTIDIRTGFGNLLLNPNKSTPSPTKMIPSPTPGSSLSILRQDSSPLGSVLSEKIDSEVFVSVPALGIDNRKVELNVNGTDEHIYDRVLTRAVAHLKGSALPGQNGNSFLFGHSKLPLLASNDYESIFTDLPKIKAGDVVRVIYMGTEYTYQISQTGVVTPKDVFITNQPSNKKMLTLMTCIPPGFDHQRYIAVGELIKAVSL